MRQRFVNRNTSNPLAVARLKALAEQNPVAKAREKSDARQRVRDTLLTAKLRVYTFTDGEDVSAFMSGVLQCTAVVGMAAERQWGSGMPRDVLGDLAVLRGGMSAMGQTLRGWDSTQAVAIEQALVRVERLNALLKAEHVFDAYRDLLAIEREYATAATS